MKQKIASPAKTREILNQYDFIFQKRYGQNFLIDLHVLNKIIQAADLSSDDYVIEVGPGIGSLTQALAEEAGQVIAIEIDKQLVPILRETLKEYDNITILNEDVLQVDMEELLAQRPLGTAVKVVANLPYYITTPIIMGLLEKKLPLEHITVMVQKEVADRMRAVPGTKNYGALSVAVQYYCEPYLVANVPAHCFIPRPNVGSAVIQLRILEEPRIHVENESFFFQVVRAAFAQRRKTLLNALYHYFQKEISLSKEEIVSCFKVMGLEEKIRGETLTIEQLGTLSDLLYSMIRKILSNTK